jgi:hypothetical protein
MNHATRFGLAVHKETIAWPCCDQAKSSPRKGSSPTRRRRFEISSAVIAPAPA